MTFLYDNKIIAKLSECVNKKTAQHADTTNLLVKKLIHNLDSQINVSTVGTNIVSETGTELTYDDLKDLNSLLMFLHVNRVNYLNHDIVSSKDEGLGDRVPVNINNNNLYVHKESLKKYLEHLGRVAKETENKVLGSLLNNVISQSQKIIGKGSVQLVDVRYKDEFHEGAELINVPLSQLSLDETGFKSITIGDLKDKPSFNNWIQSAATNVNAAYKNLNNFFGYLHDQFKTLYQRAKSVASEELYKAALNRLMALGSLFNISSLNTNVTTDATSSVVNRSRLLTNVIDNLPLRNENISIERINAFYNQLIKVDKKYNTFKNETMNHLNKASSMTQGQLTTFPLTADFSQVQQSLKNGTVNNFYIYTEHLKQAISVVFNALHNFRATFYKELKNLSGADNQILLQIGRSSADLSTYRNNVYALSDMKRRLSSSIKTKYK